MDRQAMDLQSVYGTELEHVGRLSQYVLPILLGRIRNIDRDDLVSRRVQVGLKVERGALTSSSRDCALVT